MTPILAQFPAAQRVKAVIYCLVILSAAAFSMQQRDATMLLGTIAGSMFSWLIVEGRGKGVPKFILNIVLAVAAIYLWYEVSDTSHDRNLIVSLEHFVILLMVCKLLERKSPRDLVQLVILTLVVVVASTMFSSSLHYALLLVVYFVLLVYAIVLLNLYTESITTVAALRASLLSPSRDQLPRFTRDIRTLATQCSLLLVPVAMLLFLCMPRTRGASYMMSPWDSGVYQTGFGDNVQFHDYGKLDESDTIMMEVKLSQNGVEKGSELFSPYFRGHVLESYDTYHRMWYHQGAFDELLPFSNATNEDFPPYEEEPLPANRLLVQEYTIYAPTNRFLFTISPCVSFASSDLKNLAFNPETQTISMASGSMRTIHYTVTSLAHNDPPLVPLTEDNGSIPNPRRQRVIGHHDLPPKIIQPVNALAMSIVQDILPPPEQNLDGPHVRLVVERLENYLRTNYHYSLSFDRMDPSLDDTVDFLLNQKANGGPCEYFASAMIMLCDSLGIDARMVTGFLGGEFNSVGGYYVVRQMHAHAWAEIKIPQVGWIESDPTPAGSTADSSDAFVKHWFAEVSQFIQNVWMGNFVGFDNETRRSLLEQISALFARYTRPLLDLLASIVFILTSSSMGLGIRLSFILPAIGVMAVVWWSFRRWRHERRWVVRRPSLYGKNLKLSADAAFLDELLRLISRKAGSAQQGRSPHLTPQEFVDASAQGLGSALSDARWLVQTFYRLQFGGQRVTQEMRAEISQALHRVRDALQRTADKSHLAGS